MIQSTSVCVKKDSTYGNELSQMLNQKLYDIQTSGGKIISIDKFDAKQWD